MNHYSFDKYCDIHYFYGIANDNPIQAQRFYCKHLPNRQHPNFKTFTAVLNRLRETGTFRSNMVDTGRDRQVRDVQFEENVLQLFEEILSTSTRVVGRELGCGKSTVWRVLNGEGLHPYKLQKVQALNHQDYHRRIEFYCWILHTDIQDPSFLEKVLFTDEASFSREVVFNCRTSHVWAADNPNATVIRGYQERFVNLTYKM